MNRIFRTAVLPITAASVWISISEFIRNEIIFKSYWINHYEKLGMKFPSEPLNGAVWGLWSVMFAAAVFIISGKLSFLQTALFSWYIGFVLMWTVIGNLGVLPDGLLYAAVPLSLLESFVAAFIIKKLR
ncbi:MAG TPA: hypothetical protein PL048_12440 [Leptospiraceae bacterium]|nr:hypothetical protein [Leptospiraceae bacterium]HMY65041.1 hypothetical protein [Leptospiraceae bacterium]HMZ59581.1 hypothetical protein [Leptospiraceae bacterium]HNF12715.1 hypothetical protein [Leptospiraceae bacterium]HNF22864.1 hypothetical protein [Leptospiraceae bacterium]